MIDLLATASPLEIAWEVAGIAGTVLAWQAACRWRRVRIVARRIEDRGAALLTGMMVTVTRTLLAAEIVCTVAAMPALFIGSPERAPAEPQAAMAGVVALVCLCAVNLLIGWQAWTLGRGFDRIQRTPAPPPYAGPERRGHP